MRNSVFELLRFILIIFIVNLHIRIVLGVSQANFLETLTWPAVPLFVVLSFFFLGHQNLFTRIKRLYLPFLFWSLTGFAVNLPLVNWQNIFLQFLTGQVVNTPLYYLILMVFFTLIYWILDYIPNRVKIFVYGIIVFLAFVWQYSGLNFALFSKALPVVARTYGRFSELVVYVPTGLFFAYLYQRCGNRKFFLYSAILFTILFIFFINIYQPLDFHYSGLRLFSAVCAVFSFVVYASGFSFSKNVIKIINFLGRYTFGVYLSHYVLLQGIYRIFPDVKNLMLTNYFLFIIVFVGFCYLFCYLFNLVTKYRFSLLIE